MVDNGLISQIISIASLSPASSTVFASHSSLSHFAPFFPLSRHVWSTIWFHLGNIDINEVPFLKYEETKAQRLLFTQSWEALVQSLGKICTSGSQDSAPSKQCGKVGRDTLSS